MKRKSWINKQLLLPLLGGILFMPMASQAATNFYFSSDSNAIYCSNNSNCDSWDSKRTYQSGTDTVDVSAVFANAAPDTIQAGWVTDYSGSGLGVYSDSSGSPEHAIDNESGEFEMVLLDFGAGNLMTLNQVQLGWYSGDSDMSIAAYTANNGGANTNVNIIGSTWESLVAGTGDWDYVHTAVNPGTSVVNFNNDANPDNNIASRYWLVGMYNTSLDGGSYAGYPDYGKLKMVGGKYGTPPPPPPPGVPVPAPALLMLGGIGFITRKKLFS
ncbi:MAG: hypothetical protein PVG66_04435 [Chromatiales bacterium]